MKRSRFSEERVIAILKGEYRKVWGSCGLRWVMRVCFHGCFARNCSA